MERPGHRTARPAPGPRRAATRTAPPTGTAPASPSGAVRDAPISGRPVGCPAVECGYAACYVAPPTGRAGPGGSPGRPRPAGRPARDGAAFTRPHPNSSVRGTEGPGTAPHTALRPAAPVTAADSPRSPISAFRFRSAAGRRRTTAKETA